jgi:hypothetical protein
MSGGVLVSSVLIAMKTGVGVMCSRCENGRVYARSSSALRSVSSFFQADFSCSQAEKNSCETREGSAQGPWGSAETTGNIVGGLPAARDIRSTSKPWFSCYTRSGRARRRKFSHPSVIGARLITALTRRSTAPRYKTWPPLNEYPQSPILSLSTPSVV